MGSLCTLGLRRPELGRWARNEGIVLERIARCQRIEPNRAREQACPTPLMMAGDDVLTLDSVRFAELVAPASPGSS